MPISKNFCLNWRYLLEYYEDIEQYEDPKTWSKLCERTHSLFFIFDKM